MSLTVIPDSGGDPSPMDKVVFTVHDRATDTQQVAYSRACHDEREWGDVDRARTSLGGWHGEPAEYEDREKYKVKKWLITYTLVNGDVE